MEPFALFAFVCTILAAIIGIALLQDAANPRERWLLALAAVGLCAPVVSFVVLVNLHKRLSRASHEAQRTALRFAVLAAALGIGIAVTVGWLLAR
jgi:hypothetical protein